MRSIDPFRPATFVPAVLVTGALLLAALPAVAEETARADAEIDAERHLRGLETRLLEAPSVELDFAITAGGAVSAELSGSLSFSDTSISLRAAGSFAGRELNLELRTTDDGRLVGGHVDGDGEATPRFDVERPPHWREAVALGFTRMGLLHNLALLAGGRMPDHADIGVGDWIQLSGFAAAEPYAGARGVLFDLTVAGQPAAEDVRLWLDEEGRPTERRQTVDFPQGQMRVVERYSDVSFGG